MLDQDLALLWVERFFRLVMGQYPIEASARTLVFYEFAWLLLATHYPVRQTRPPLPFGFGGFARPELGPIGRQGSADFPPYGMVGLGFRRRACSRRRHVPARHTG